MRRGRCGRGEGGRNLYEGGLPCGRGVAAAWAGVRAAPEGNKERVGGLMYIITGSVQCNGAKDATADRLMLRRGSARPRSLSTLSKSGSNYA